MIQDIFPHRLNNHYDPDAKQTPDSPVFCFTESSVLCRMDDGFHLPRIKDCQKHAELTYLFSLDDTACFLLRGTHEMLEPPIAGFTFVPIRKLRKQQAAPKELAFAIYTGLQLAGWYENNLFCGHCGHPMEPDGEERALRCMGCGRVVYPRINPAVIVGVLNRRENEPPKMLVTKYRVGYNNYALVAGFTEIGETLEETVAREVMEEAGLSVKNIRYYKSQPWGIADDLLVGFYCEADGNTEIHMDTNELKLAEWKTREEIELQPDEYSLTGEMMRRFKEGLV